MREKILSTGWLYVSFPGGFAQIPPGFGGQSVPDEYIFQPDWNRERVNAWWGKRER
jgi:hypothetical protein